MKLTPQYIVMLTGVLLAVAGVVIVTTHPIPVDTGGGTFNVAIRDGTAFTNHVGLVVAILGAALLVAGFLGPAAQRWINRKSN